MSEGEQVRTFGREFRNRVRDEINVLFWLGAPDEAVRLSEAWGGHIERAADDALRVAQGEREECPGALHDNVVTLRPFAGLIALDGDPEETTLAGGWRKIIAALEQQTDAPLGDASVRATDPLSR